MTVRSLLALLRASNASNGAWPFAFRGLATAAASSSVSSPSAALAAAAASSAGAGAASSAGAGAARIGTAVSGARAPSARAAAAPPTAAAAQRADIRRLLLARTEPWPYHEAAVSRHQVQYTPPAVNGAGLPAGSTAAWTASSRRVGVVGLKAGMTADWDKWGVRHALTVIRLEDVVVTGQVLEAERGYTALQVGAGTPKLSTLDRARAALFASRGLAPRRVITEFRVTPDALLPVGTPLVSQHFVPGQMVKVSGVTQGKGFQGAMKRHGFAGQGASHGNSLSHRAIGATGCRHDPGRVIRGKKMPGQMGGDWVSIDVKVYKVDVKANLLYVKGALPGKPGSHLRVCDSLKSPHRAPPPFPTYALTDTDRAALARWAAGAYLSPQDELHLFLKGALPPDYEREPPFELVCAPPEINPFAVPEHGEGDGE